MEARWAQTVFQPNVIAELPLGGFMALAAFGRLIFSFRKSLRRRLYYAFDYKNKKVAFAGIVVPKERDQQ